MGVSGIHTLRCSALEKALWQTRQASFLIPNEDESGIATVLLLVLVWEMRICREARDEVEETSWRPPSTGVGIAWGSVAPPRS